MAICSTCKKNTAVSLCANRDCDHHICFDKECAEPCVGCGKPLCLVRCSLNDELCDQCMAEELSVLGDLDLDLELAA